MNRAYRLLLRLYPYDFKSAFAAEMFYAFAQIEPKRRVAELAGLLAGVVSEWIAKLASNPYERGRSLPDLRVMRPAGMPRELWFARAACSSDTSR